MVTTVNASCTGPRYFGELAEVRANGTADPQSQTVWLPRAIVSLTDGSTAELTVATRLEDTPYTENLFDLREVQ